LPLRPSLLSQVGLVSLNQPYFELRWRHFGRGAMLFVRSGPPPGGMVGRGAVTEG